MKNEENNKQDLKNEILKISMELFSTKGIKSVKMDDVAAAIGISKRTLYELFSDKETLLTESLLYFRNERDKYFSTLLARSNNVLEVIFNIFEKNLQIIKKTHSNFFTDLRRYRSVFALQEKYKKRDLQQAISFFELGVDQGIFRKDVNYEIINRLISLHFQVLFDSDMLNDYSLTDVYQSIMFVFMRGLVTAKGSVLLEEFISKKNSLQ